MGPREPFRGVPEGLPHSTAPSMLATTPRSAPCSLPTALPAPKLSPLPALPGYCLTEQGLDLPGFQAARIFLAQEAGEVLAALWSEGWSRRGRSP